MTLTENQKFVLKEIIKKAGEPITIDNLNDFGIWNYQLPNTQEIETAVQGLIKAWIIERDSVDNGDKALFITSKGFIICSELKLI